MLLHRGRIVLHSDWWLFDRLKTSERSSSDSQHLIEGDDVEPTQMAVVVVEGLRDSMASGATVSTAGGDAAIRDDSTRGRVESRLHIFTARLMSGIVGPLRFGRG
jgi:hypothetical protein